MLESIFIFFIMVLCAIGSNLLLFTLNKIESHVTLLGERLDLIEEHTKLLSERINLTEDTLLRALRDPSSSLAALMEASSPTPLREGLSGCRENP